jgi:hypothetical protein
VRVRDGNIRRRPFRAGNRGRRWLHLPGCGNRIAIHQLDKIVDPRALHRLIREEGHDQHARNGERDPPHVCNGTMRFSEKARKLKMPLEIRLARISLE